MDANDFAKLLMSDERKSWENPQELLNQVMISKGATAADLGCGPGFFTLPLAEKVGKEGKVYAVDANQIMLDHLSANLKKFSSHDDLAELIPLNADVSARNSIPDASVDLVLFSDILHDLEDRKKFFVEVDRILRKSGIVVDLDWKKQEPNNHGPPMEWRLSENESRSILKENGFKIIHALNPGPYHYGFVCQGTSDLQKNL